MWHQVGPRTNAFPMDRVWTPRQFHVHAVVADPIVWLDDRQINSATMPRLNAVDVVLTAAAHVGRIGIIAQHKPVRSPVAEIHALRTSDRAFASLALATSD